MAATEIIKLAIYYLSYLYFPAALALALFVMRKRSAQRFLAVAFLAAITILAYARFVEPRILLTVRHEATLSRCFAEGGSARLAVFSDIHEGLFGNTVGVNRVAEAVKKARPDAAFIAGDFVYFLETDRFDETFAALATVLLIAGHTHGGQINIPGMTCLLMPGICRVARYGFADTERGLVFVTSGIGMVGLPMRFNAAPRIDVIDLVWRACPEK